MNFGQLLSDVYELLEDPLQTAWTNRAVARAVKKAVRRIANAVGRDDTQTLLSLVESQQEYVLPTGIRRVNKVRIIPEQGGEPRGAGLLQLASPKDLPLTLDEESDPQYFVLRLTGGTNANQYSLIFYPVPARSATDAIVVDHAVDTIISSDSPATAPQLAVELPFPEQFDEAMLYYTAGFLLAERSDEGDMQESMKFEAMAKAEIRENGPVDSLSFRADLNRAMP